MHHSIADVVCGLHREGDWNDDQRTRGCVTRSQWWANHKSNHKSKSQIICKNDLNQCPKSQIKSQIIPPNHKSFEAQIKSQIIFIRTCTFKNV